MKKNVLSVIAVLAIATVAVFNMNLDLNQGNEMSILALANIEALAQREADKKELICYKDIVSPTREEILRNPEKSWATDYMCSPCGLIAVIKTHGDSAKCKE